MDTSMNLENKLMGIHRKGYPAYKDLRGSYQFPGYQFHIEHVQGDPFASPSKLSISVNEETAKFPKQYYDIQFKKIALQDFLTRKFGKAMNEFTFQAKGSGKSGLIQVSRCGQEILERTAFEIKNGKFLVRFEVGFPANGRTINAVEIRKILFEYLPKIVRQSMMYPNLNPKEVQEVIALAEDQYMMRKEIRERGYIAFVANGSILPRESGVSQRPMKGAVPFISPKSMEVELSLPNKGIIKGMAIPKGISLIVGGGYHGKSTLLKALEQGIYNHISGDGREYVMTDETAVKIRAEDGRSISCVNISAFINDLPNGKDTVKFYTEDASGSTSQAANVVEAVQAGAGTLLIDEDTCATNFMVRDELMQKVVAREKEPITPFIEQARDLYEKAGVSVVLVAGSSGAYFSIADQVIQMEQYRAVDITGRVREVLEETQASGKTESKISVEVIEESRKNRMLKARKSEKKHDQIKIKQFGKDSFSIGKEQVDLKYVEQILDQEQTTTLSYCLKILLEQMEKQEKNVEIVVEALWKQIVTKGLASLCDGNYLPVSFAQIRKQEIYACLNRYRGLL